MLADLRLGFSMNSGFIEYTYGYIGVYLEIYMQFSLKVESKMNILV